MKTREDKKRSSKELYRVGTVKFPSILSEEGRNFRHPVYGSLLRTARHRFAAYPMSWTGEQAQRLVREKLSERKDNFQLIGADQQRCKTAVHAGKSAFDEAFNTTQQKTYPHRQYTQKRPHTGPTRQGSPLYNRRADQWSKIQLEELEAEPNNKETIAILDLIAGANKRYVLADNKIIQKTDHKLSDESKQSLALTKKTEMIDLRMGRKSSVGDSRKGSDVMDARMTMQSLPIVKLTQHVENEDTDYQVLQRTSDSKLLDVHSSRPKSGRSTSSWNKSSNGSETSSSKSRVARKENHWVDNISVSSLVKSERSNQRSTSAKTRKSHVSADKSQPELVLPEPPEKVKYDEPKDNTPKFPDFICPSSEEKSKEYAVKLWVINSDFERALKTIPLI